MDPKTGGNCGTLSVACGRVIRCQDNGIVHMSTSGNNLWNMMLHGVLDVSKETCLRLVEACSSRTQNCQAK